MTDDDLYLAYSNLIVVSDAAPASYANAGWSAFKDRIKAASVNSVSRRE